MAVHLDVQTQFDDRSVRSSADDLQRYLKRSGDAAGKSWADGFSSAAPKIEKAMQKAADATGAVSVAERKAAEVRKLSEAQAKKVAAAEKELATLRTVEHPRAAALVAQAERTLEQALKQQERITTQVVQSTERLNKTRRDQAASVRSSADEIRNAMTQAESSTASFATSLTGLGTSMATLGRIATPAAMVGLGAAIVQVGAVAASASQSLLLLPAAVGTVGTAIGTLKLATMGLDDAFKNISDPAKFSESLRSLAPNAQQALLSIRNMLPALTQLQQATQNSLFTGVGQQLNQLANTFLPTIQSATTSVAASFNQMFMGATNQLMSGSSQQAIQEFLNNVTSAFQQLAPAAAPLTKALTDLMAAGSGVLPDLAKAASDAAVSFSAFISHARASGQLQQWLSDGLATLKDLTSIAWEVGRAFMSLAPTARDILPTIKTMLSEIHDIMPLITIAAGTLGAPIGVWATAIDNAARGFNAIKTVVESVGNAVIPILNSIGQAVDAMLTPIRGAIDVANKVLGVNIPQIPGIGKIPQIGAGQPTQGGLPGAQAERRGGTSAFQLPGGGIPGVPGGGFPLASGDGDWWKQGGFTGKLNLPNAVSPGSWVDEAIRRAQEARGGGSGGPAVPYAPLPGLAPGLQMDSTLFGAQTRVADTQTALEEKKARLNQLQADNTATDNEIQNAKNDVLKAEREHAEAQMRFAEAQQSAFKEQNKQLQGMTAAMQDFGAQLDSDFGISSKGLPGIVENLVKMAGNFALAGPMAMLNNISNANPNQGSGLIGMLGSMGAFGPQYMPGASGSGGYGPSAMGPAGLQPGLMPTGQPYGLPPGTDTGGYGSSGAVFPAWVHQLEQTFGVKASTYSGHQESDRHEAGYAPNPQGLNRGIDWSGPVQNMQAFADYLSTIPGSLEQVIWQNPSTGQTTTIAGGSPVNGYYDTGTLAEHQNHVHTRQSMGLPVPGMLGSSGGPVPVNVVNGSSLTDPLSSAMGQWSADWNAIAQKESGGNWSINTGNGYSGGLQFSPSSWAAAGGTQYAPNAYQATPFQQAMTAENLLKMQGPGAWPNTFTPGSSGPGIYGAGFSPASAGGGGGSGLMGMAGAAMQQPGGMAYPSAGGGGFQGLGGLPMAALSTAASAVPGLGAAAQVGMQLANRVIAYGGQVAGIGISGLLETLSVGDNPMGSFGNSWFGKLAGGFAGARPALPNMAGKPVNAPEGQASPMESLAQKGGNTANITINNQGATPDQNGKDVAAHTAAMWAPSGRQA